MTPTSLKKILLVDDDELTLRLMQKTLSAVPFFEVVLCHNGQEALETAKETDFDVIITDIMMPEKNGIEFVQELRETNHHTPILMISSGDFKENRREYLNQACFYADEVLGKPFVAEELLRALDDLIRRRDEMLKR